MSKSQREKGKRGEREFRAILDAKFGPGGMRGAPLQAACGGHAPDVQHPALAGYWFEVKVGARPDPWKALDQADVATGPPDVRVPVAVCKRDRRRWIACMDLTDWLAWAADTMTKAQPAFGPPRGGPDCLRPEGAGCPWVLADSCGWAGGRCVHRRGDGEAP